MYTSPRRIRAYVLQELRHVHLYELDDGEVLCTSHLEEATQACEQRGHHDPDAVDAWYRGLTDAQRQRLVQQAMRG